MSSPRTSRSTGPGRKPATAAASAGGWRRPGLAERGDPRLGRHRQDVSALESLSATGRRRRAPESILAATFARKAAGEILARVRRSGWPRRRSTTAVPRAGRASRLAARRPGLRPAAWPSCCGNLHRLRIGTLDSFFVRLAGSFTLELGLPQRLADCRSPGRRPVAAGSDSPRAGRRQDRRDAGAGPFAVQRRNDPLDQPADRRAGRRVCTTSIARPTSRPGTDCSRPPRAAGSTNWRRRSKPLAAAARPADTSIRQRLADDIAQARGDDWETFIAKGLAKAAGRRRADV